MKILMIHPRPSPRTIGLQHLMIIEPLELEVLAALKRDVDDVVIIDMMLEKESIEYFITKHKPNVLCLTGYITNVSNIISYCKKAKSIDPNISTIVGGVHCEVVPEDFNVDVIDYRVVRNATRAFIPLLNHIENKADLPKGVLKPNENVIETELPEFDFYMPVPAREYVDKYRRKYFYIFHDDITLIKTSFGCPYKCSFCFCRVITKNLYNQRPIDEVIEEISNIKQSSIYIVDDDFLIDKKRLKAFTSKIKQRRIKKNYIAYGRADFIVKNPDTMKDLAEIGLNTVIVGFESFSDKELDLYNKKTDSNIYKKTMEILKANNIDVYATIIVSPDWGKAEFKNMVTNLKKLGIHYVNLQPLTPLPATDISYPDDQMVIKREEYDLWDLAHVSVKPTKLSIPDYYREILKAYNSILFQPKVLWMYIKTYSIKMLYKIYMGSVRVTKQYNIKIKEAEHHV